LQFAAEDGSSETNRFPLEQLKTFFSLTWHLPCHGTDICKVIVAMQALSIKDSLILR